MLGKITSINGPVIKGSPMDYFKIGDLVYLGPDQRLGEVIGLNGLIGTIQAYDETDGLSLNQIIKNINEPLSVHLGPGLLGHVFDGVQRPLSASPLSQKNKKWFVEMFIKEGDFVNKGQKIGKISDIDGVPHFILSGPNQEGKALSCVVSGSYTMDDTLAVLEDSKSDKYPISIIQKWPIRKARPIKERYQVSTPILTGQRILDVFFPLALGGTSALAGGFGVGKSFFVEEIAKWSDVDVVVYIACGIRGNEVNQIYDNFKKIHRPRSKMSLLERTVFIVNSSDMPVAAREASMYTGITIGEFYRDMGYKVAVIADSTSRFAEALRELSGRLEEMPAEEGFPAYLPSRLSKFYERGGNVKTLDDTNGQLSIIGTLSPPGGDLSEPVTEITRGLVQNFLVFDQSKALNRFFPAIDWSTSYSEYVSTLKPWYDEHVSFDFMGLRQKTLSILNETIKLQEMVQLVGKDVLPDEKRLLLEIGQVIEKGFLQQDAFYEDDSNVPIHKQHLMLEMIHYLHEKGQEALKENVPVSLVTSASIYEKVRRMKYNISNDDLQKIGILMQEIDAYYEEVTKKYME
jgi:V/A-type H+-transporting ATPase subunit A